MKEIFFGWLSKPFYMWTGADGLICTAEFLLILLIIFTFIIIYSVRSDN